MNEKFTEQELKEAWERNARARKFKNGSVWSSDNYGAFTIIGRLDSKMLYIQFHNTKAIAIRSYNEITNGQVKDWYLPSIFGVGYFGEGIYNHKSYKQLYHRWYSMIYRCYGNENENKTYNDVEISKDWLNFQNYCRDILEMMKEQGLENLDGYEIDKDIKGSKIYSKDTVSIVTQEENNDEMINRIHNTVYIGINLKTGEEIEFTNQSQFAREHNLYRDAVSSVLKGRQKTARNWTFYRKEDKAPNIEDFRDTIYIAENIVTKELIEFTNQRSFAKEHNIDQPCISRILAGKQKTTKNWTFYRKD